MVFLAILLALVPVNSAVAIQLDGIARTSYRATGILYSGKIYNLMTWGMP